LAARVKQGRHFARATIERSDIASLPCVAPAAQASIRQIVFLGESSMLVSLGNVGGLCRVSCDDMVYLMREIRVILVQQAVFAGLPRSLCD
jgi:hypothetical protein